MILICPFCETRYLVPAQSFAQGARRVRCARCLHNWQVDAPNNLDVVATGVSAPSVAQVAGDGDPPSFAQELASQNSSENTGIESGGAGAATTGQLPVPYTPQTPAWVRRVFAASCAVLVVVILLWSILARQNIVAQWPALERSYQAVGLPIYRTGDGIILDNVRYEIVYESGAMNLVVTGLIINTTAQGQKLPHIKAVALGVDGLPVVAWQIDAVKPVLGAGERVALHSTIKAPKETVTNLKLDYIELPHEP